MDTTSIAENTTVVGPPSTVNRKDLSHHQNDFSKIGPGASSNSHVGIKRAANDFVRAPDFALEERQFFVPIVADGLIGALQKLDQQLQTVCFLAIFCRTTER